MWDVFLWEMLAPYLGMQSVEQKVCIILSSLPFLFNSDYWRIMNFTCWSLAILWCFVRFIIIVGYFLHDWLIGLLFRWCSLIFCLHSISEYPISELSMVIVYRVNITSAFLHCLCYWLLSRWCLTWIITKPLNKYHLVYLW
jgi:hypothetical protein